MIEALVAIVREAVQIVSGRRVVIGVVRQV
jgi:hypothetical protein